MGGSGRRLAGARVAGQCDHWRLGAASGLPSARRAGARGREPPPQNGDPAVARRPVGSSPAATPRGPVSRARLREPLGGAARALASAEGCTLQLRQLDLELSLTRLSGMLGGVPRISRVRRSPAPGGRSRARAAASRDSSSSTSSALGAGAYKGFFQLDQLSTLADCVGAGAARPGRARWTSAPRGLDPCRCAQAPAARRARDRRADPCASTATTNRGRSGSAPGAGSAAAGVASRRDYDLQR